MPRNTPGKIDFYFEGQEVPVFFDEKGLREWLMQVIRKESGEPGTISFIFCSEEYLLELNSRYLEHDDLTDVITFDYCDELGGVSGDIFISLERVGENAVLHGSNFSEEFYRVVVHGVLHLLGYNDKNEANRLSMREKENDCLSLLL